MAEQKSTDAIRDFMKEVKREYRTGIAREHSYRSHLKRLCEDVGINIQAINEAKRIACGAPDLTVTRKGITIGYLEAKDIDKRIRGFGGANKDQFDSYTNNLDNLIYTNCLDWDFYREGILKYSVTIGKLDDKGLKLNSENFAELANYLEDFLDQRPKTIKTAEELTKYMAKRTKMIRLSFGKAMMGDDPVKALIAQRDWIDKVLVKDITTEQFANMYAQTITYGLFVAKLYSELHSKTSKTFTRQNISNLLPTTYPFLKNLFNFVADDTLNPAIDGFIDDLINLYSAADLKVIMATYGKSNEREDPFLHFYEDFLKEYNPRERELAGVYYTPKPVVDFIVRAVDWVLKEKFNLQDGLAHSGKTKINWKIDRKDKGEGYKTKKRDVHKVQILDPATGTGTFLAQTIQHIAKSVKKTTAGNWPHYVDKDLLPRLHGFEFMMAPYAMAYLKLDMVLEELDYKPTSNPPDRMSIYLTNSLTEANKDIPHLPFSKYLVDEAHGATDIKDNFPIMCVIGNPPYLGESTNRDPWIERLIEDYKKEPGGHAPLKERNSKWLNDDYVKFLRLAQHMVSKNHNGKGEGVVGMITNHGYLDNPTFRGMRWQLMNNFDGIYILDLHGNTRKKEVTPKGEPDKNVFDIQQGVSIIIAWKQKQKEGAKNALAQVFHGDLWGGRQAKFDHLRKETLDSKLFKKIKPRAPNYFLTPKDYNLLTEYEKGFKIMDLMELYGVSMTTAHDEFCMGSEADLIDRFEEFKDTEADANLLHKKFNVAKKQGWSILKAHESLSKIGDISKLVQPVLYRPFDKSYILYHDDVVWRTVRKIMRHFVSGKNVGLIIGRQGQVVGPMDWNLAFVQDTISDINVFYRGGGTVFPLYTYPDEIKNLDTNGHSRRVNMDEKIRKAIEDSATDKKHGTPDEYAIFDYIYGILHTPAYRKRYAEFLKTDYPYIPYPKTPDEFWHLSQKGKELREIHLLPEDKKYDTDAYRFDIADTNRVERPRLDDGKVFINDAQYFDNIPERAWNFYIGGYQPAQKWLKDRKGEVLEYADLTHYQRIIAVLVKTYETMDEIVWTRG